MNNNFLVTRLKSWLSDIFWFLVRTSDRYRDRVRAVARKTGLERVLLSRSLFRRLLLTKDEPQYQVIFDTAPVTIDPAGAFELHLLFCERDLLRGLWALKSFYRYSGLNPKLVIHDDGSLSPQSLNTLRLHFRGCSLISGKNFDDALDGHPVCRYYRNKHVLARKILDVLLVAQSDYVMVMDTDVLWFSDSPQIQECLSNSRPFYLYGLQDSYARNTRFLNEHCGLFPAEYCNSGMIGFRRREFLDLDFIENALDRMIHIPKDLVAQSIGFPVPDSVKQGIYDPVESASWWVMEQTLYALLYGRCSDAVRLNMRDPDAGKLHQFVNTAITDNTALQHYLFDSHWNAQFPVGVEYLLNKWGQRENSGTPRQ